MRECISGLIMAGGHSQRMRAGGRASHKGLRTVMGKPLIEWSIEALRSNGFRHVCVSVSSSEPELIDWIVERRSRELEDTSLTLIVEDEPLGTIGAASRLPSRTDDVVVVNVDNLTNLDLHALVRFHQETGAAATIASHEHAFRIPFGRLEVTGPRVTGYIEKPALSVRVSSGTYVLSRTAIDAIPQNTRTDVPQLIATLLSRGHLVLAYDHSADWLDVNDETALASAESLVSGPSWSRGARQARADV